MATADQIIKKFELQVNDVTELSSSEELMLLNRVYQRVCDTRPWEFLKTNVTGTMSGSGVDGFYISVPEDFAYLYENYNWTDNSYSTQINQSPIVVFVGSNRAPYYVKNYADRNQYLGSTGYCYYDFTSGKIYFTGTPVSTTYSLDYIKFPVDLTTATSPVFPARFHDILVYGMATENEVIQLSPKAKSYAPENLNLYNQYLDDLALWNARLILN